MVRGVLFIRRGKETVQRTVPPGVGVINAQNHDVCPTMRKTASRVRRGLECIFFVFSFVLRIVSSSISCPVCDMRKGAKRVHAAKTASARVADFLIIFFGDRWRRGCYVLAGKVRCRWMGWVVLQNVLGPAVAVKNQVIYLYVKGFEMSVFHRGEADRGFCEWS